MRLEQRLEIKGNVFLHSNLVQLMYTLVKIYLSYRLFHNSLLVRSCTLKVTVCWSNFFPPLSAIAAKHFIKLDILDASLILLPAVSDLTIFLIP